MFLGREKKPPTITVLTGVLYAVQLFTEEFLHTVCVPLEDAEFFNDVPTVVQQLEHRV